MGTDYLPSTRHRHVTKRQRAQRQSHIAPYRLRACYPKVQFETKEGAEQIREKMVEEGKEQTKAGYLHTYLCPDCGYVFWHIGHTD